MSGAYMPPRREDAEPSVPDAVLRELCDAGLTATAKWLDQRMGVAAPSRAPSRGVAYICLALPK